MDALEKVQSWLGAVKAFIEENTISTTIDRVFIEYEDEIVADNILHLRRGERPDGSEIAPSYEGWYAYKKRYDNRMNMMDDPSRPFYAPNLAITGSEFYDSIKLEVTDTEIAVTSTSEFWEGYVPPMPGWQRSMTPLHQYYGEVLGITDTFLEGEIEPKYKNEISEAWRRCFE